MKRSVTTQAIEQIRRMIVSGQVGPGDKLPTEAELAGRLGVSRSSLREAVRALAVLRVLEVRQGAGTYVSSLAPELLLDVVGFGTELVNDPSVLDVFEVRRLLETEATAAAALGIDAPRMGALRDCMARMDAAGRVDELVEADQAFHHVIAAATGNSVLVALLDNLSSRTLSARIWRGVMEQGAVERTKQWHHAILQAVEARDPQLARAADLVHLMEGETWLRRALGADTGHAGAPAP